MPVHKPMLKLYQSAADSKKKTNTFRLIISVMSFNTQCREIPFALTTIMVTENSTLLLFCRPTGASRVSRANPGKANIKDTQK